MLQTLQRSRTPSGIAYLDQGEGDETVILVHGVGMRIEAWQPQIEFLQRRARVIAVDLPGHGLSAALGKPPVLSNYVDWFGDFLSELDLGDVNVVGHSMGALIATGAVSSLPDRIRRVALLNGVYKRSITARHAVEARADEIVSGVFDRNAPLDRWFSSEERGGDAYRLVGALLQAVDVAGYATAYRAFATGDSLYADCWPKVSCPALFLTGDGDLNSTAEMAREMAAATVRGEAVVIAGHRHMVNLTAPEEVNEALMDWLNWEVEK